MDWIAFLVGGLGIGAIVKSVTDHYLFKRKAVEERTFSVKKEAYLSLLESLHAALTDPNRSSDYEHWINVVSIVGSPEVRISTNDLINSKPGGDERNKAHLRLLNSIRKDLCIDPRELIV